MKQAIQVLAMLLCGALLCSGREMVITKTNGMKQRIEFFDGSGGVYKESTFYLDDKGKEVFHGECKRFNRDGTPRLVVNFRNGKPHGKTIVYSDSGRTIAIWNSKDGLASGPRIIFNESNSLTSVEFFTNGVHLAPFSGDYEYDGTTVKVDMGRVVGGDLMKPENRPFVLGEWSKQYMACGDVTNSERYAAELLNLVQGPDAPSNGIMGISAGVHTAHNVLGRVALRRGDTTKAKQHLLLAGEADGNGSPNMALAKELLERGEKDVVLSYLALCAKFRNKSTFDEWANEVKAGKMPDFGSNLD